MFRVVFSGQVLDGFAPAAVRAAVAQRLALQQPQLDRLFSGQSVVLKKVVSQEASASYIAELRRLGMNARLEPLAGSTTDVPAMASFKVVFWGKLLRGYDQNLVMRAVTRRLRVSPPQLVQMFGGSKVVLKRGVNAEMGARYVTELARIGMLVELEVETEALSATSLRPVQPMATVQDATYDNLLSTQLDVSHAMRTALSSSDVMGATSEEVEEGVVPNFVPSGIVESAMTAHARMTEAAPAAPKAAARNTLQVKCPQCGRHQLPAASCRACGLEMSSLPKARPELQAARMDSSAYGAVTTLMKGLQRAVAPPTVVKAAGAGVPGWMFDLRGELAQMQMPAARGISRQHIVLAVTGVAIVLLVMSLI